MTRELFIAGENAAFVSMQETSEPLTSPRVTPFLRVVLQKKNKTTQPLDGQCSKNRENHLGSDLFVRHGFSRNVPVPRDLDTS